MPGLFSACTTRKKEWCSVSASYVNGHTYSVIDQFKSTSHSWSPWQYPRLASSKSAMADSKPLPCFRSCRVPAYPCLHDRWHQKSIKKTAPPIHPPPLIIQYTVRILNENNCLLKSILLPNYADRQSSTAAAQSCLREPTTFSTTLPWAVWRLRECKREGGKEERWTEQREWERGGTWAWAYIHG